MAAIIKGMENGMRETMIAMGGADKVLLEQQDVPAEQEHLADQAPGRTLADARALSESAPLNFSALPRNMPVASSKRVQTLLSRLARKEKSQMPIRQLNWSRESRASI